MTRMSVDLAPLLEAELQTAADAATTLGAQLGPRATVFVFLRHFG